MRIIGTHWIIDMKTGFISIGADNIPKSMLIKAKIAPTLRIFASNPPVFTDYPNLENASTAIDNAIRDFEMVIILLSLPCYSIFKDEFVKKYGFKTRFHSEILETINENFEGVQFDNIRKHCEFPVDAELYPDSCGLYTGFSVTINTTPVVILPFDMEDTVVMIKEQLIPILTQTSGITRPEDDISAFNELSEIIRKTNASIAVAGTPTADFLKRPAIRTRDAYSTFRFSRNTSSRGEMSQTEYAVLLAKNAAEDLSCLFGIAMSSIFLKDDKYCVALGIFSDISTEATEYIFEKTDDTGSSLSAAANELFTRLSAKIKREIEAEGNEGVDFETF